MSEPKRYSQYANMFSRGNATSGAPICSGMIQFANPANSGVANISSMIVPCIVNAWLNCSFDMIWVPGRASSARMTSAMHATDAEERERRDQIQRADRLVVSGRQPLDDDISGLLCAVPAAHWRKSLLLPLRHPGVR